MELQVLIHGVNVVKDVLNDPGNDSHPVGVVEVTLREEETGHVTANATAALKDATFLRDWVLSPPSCEFSQKTFDRRRRSCRYTRPGHLSAFPKQKTKTINACKKKRGGYR